MMGGILQVDSQPGKGSVFFFTLDLLRSESPARTFPETPKSKDDWMGRIQGARLLLVEDHPVNQELSKEILTEMGLDVSIAASGPEALNLLAASEYDLVLMDVQLPVMSGLETTQAIRKMDGLAHLPIVAMTADNTLLTKKECFAAGMNDYLSKPLDLERLVTLLMKWLGDQHQEHLPNDGQPILPHAAAAPQDAVFPDDLPGLRTAEGLKRLQGNKGLYRRLLLAFLHRHATREDEFEREIRAGNFQIAASLAHSLKGTAANLSLTDVARNASTLEKIAQNGTMEDVLRACEELKTSLTVAGSSINTLAALLEEEEIAVTLLDEPPPNDVDMLMNRFYASLAAQDMKASDLFGALKMQIRDFEFQEDMQRLESMIGNLEFGEAADALTRLARKLNIVLGG